MLKSIKKLFVNSSLAAVFAVPLLVPAIASAQPNIDQNLCAGTNLSVTAQCDPTAEGDGAADRVNSIIATVINIFSIVVGVVAVIMIIFGGFKYITSGGDSGNITSAKNTILFAIVGLIIVALAQIIVKFVLGRATGGTAA